MADNLFAILHDYAKVVTSVGLGTRRRLLHSAWKDLKVLMVSDPQIDEPGASVIVIKPEHFRAPNFFCIKGKRPVQILYLEGNMPNTSYFFHTDTRSVQLV